MKLNLWHPCASPTDPWIQHNSLASAAGGYPYNASVYSELPPARSHHAEFYLPNQGHMERMGGYDSGLYAYAGGLPDTMPRNSFSHPVGFGPPPVGVPVGYTMEGNNGRYASTIYPDPPERDLSRTRFRRGSGCEHCAATRREEHERMAEDVHCDCNERRNHRIPRSHHHKHAEPERARAFSESSSGDEGGEIYRSTGSRRSRRIDDNMLHLSPPRRGRLRSSGSGQRTASRPPGLPSVKQRSVNSESAPDPSARPRHIERENGGRHIELNHPIQGDYTRVRSGQRHQSEGSESHDHVEPEDLRLDAIHIDDHWRQEASHIPARARTAIDGARRDRSTGWPEELRGEYRASHYDLPPQGVIKEDVRLVGPSNVSRDYNEVKRRRDRSQSFSTQFGSPLREEFAEVFPLPSKQNSPSRMHRQEYSGNAPAGPTTRSKLHPEFPHRSEW
jgi:hypothetical protein